MTIHQRNGIRIRTEFIYPPIPDRRFDWVAVDDETFDGAPDGKTRNDRGFGETEDEAIENLLEIVCQPPGDFDEEDQYPGEDIDGPH